MLFGGGGRLRYLHRCVIYVDYLVNCVICVVVCFVFASVICLQPHNDTNETNKVLLRGVGGWGWGVYVVVLFVSVVLSRSLHLSSFVSMFATPNNKPLLMFRYITKQATQTT